MSHRQSFHSGFHADHNFSRSEWSLDINFIKKCEWCYRGCSGWLPGCCYRVYVVSSPFLCSYKGVLRDLWGVQRLLRCFKWLLCC